MQTLLTQGVSLDVVSRESLDSGLLSFGRDIGQSGTLQERLDFLKFRAFLDSLKLRSEAT